MLKATKEQEIWGSAATLLSLDVVLPFYSYMGIPLSDPQRLHRLIREVILQNRKAFEAQPDQIPDLKNRMLKAITNIYAKTDALQFERWVNHSFVIAPGDRGIYGSWEWLFRLSRRNDERWSKLRLPDSLSKEARLRFSRAIDREELHALADEVDKEPHTDWDIEMYSLHGFDDDDNDPYNWVLLIIGYRRIKQFMKWLVSSLAREQVAEFVKSANVLQELIPELKPTETLVIPREITNDEGT